VNIFRWLLVLVCAVLVAALGTGRAWAEDPDVVRAKKSYTRGMAHYHLREYSQAIAAFEEAYRIHPDPVFLFNIAQANRLSEKYEEALHFYRTYLRAAPKAPNKKEVEARIEELQALVRAHKNISSAPPVGPLTPAATAPPVEKSVATKEPASPAQPAQPSQPQPPTAVEKPAPKPVARPAPTNVVATPAPTPARSSSPASDRKTKPWVWGVVAGSVVVAAGLAVGLGVGLSVGRSAPNSYPSISYALEGGTRRGVS
jgi:tetratricopeptide (TPR) repeat protein